MIPAVKNYLKKRFFTKPVTEKNSSEAYDIWSANYDMQPGNLMLDLDETLFPKLLAQTSIQNKAVADIGCGTGRHWPKILQQQPLSLTGFDVSEGMLNKLKEKFPGANTYRITDDLFSTVANASFDTIISTLTVAHIENIETALQAWCRILKADCEIIITDFHPKLLAVGGKRTFKHNNEQLAVKNYVHSTDTIKDILLQNGFRVVAEHEISIDETMKHYYIQQNALPVYERFKGFPVIYGVHLIRGHDPE
ncbi:MAG TPA: class I SAM-dependent methyltransferase [Mucilaginibacter sp.]|nr:class I SAM-dependent methyltransferase [Mucilaginibacter sp.]